MQAVRFSGCQAGLPQQCTARPSTCKPPSSSRRSLPVARTRGSTLVVQASPCVLITAPDGITNLSLQHLASEVRQQLGIQAVVLAPAAAGSATQRAASHNRHQQPGEAAAAAGPTPAASLTFEQELQLQPCPDGDLSYSLAGATAADCVLCAVDQTQGLLRALDLSPVLVLVGVSRGPALSSDMPLDPAVAVAQQAALLGLPAVATCLATTSASAPMQPAVAAAVQLLARVLLVLQHTNSSASSRGSGGQLTSARNFPRAHFPFPEEGRWALGTQLPLPHSASATEASSSSSWQKYDSWALGDDNSWLGEYSSSRSSSRNGSGRHGGGDADPDAARQQAYSTLRGAFADGDLLLCLNVPPTWQEAAGFAPTRPGVLWHCWQVEARRGVQHQQQQGQPQQEQYSSSNNGSSYSSGTAAGEVGAGAAAAAAGGRWSHLYGGDAGSSSSSSSSSRSWEVDGADLFGRTLPSTSYGSTVPSGSNFVGQDNTRKVLTDSRPGAAAAATSASSFYGSVLGSSTAAAAAAVHEPRTWGAGSHAAQNQQRQLPCSFTVRRGTLLSDAAACGDVEAVFSGRAALSVVQAWPGGHPLSCRDELLLAALDEGAEGSGLPAWLLLE